MDSGLQEFLDGVIEKVEDRFGARAARWLSVAVIVLTIASVIALILWPRS